MLRAFNVEGLSGQVLHEWTTRSVLRAYEQTFGTIDPLRREFGASFLRVSRHEDADRLPSALEQRQLYSRAISQIWFEESRARGKSLQRRGDWRLALSSLACARTLRESILNCVECFEATDNRLGRMELRVRSDQAELRLDSMTTYPGLASCVFELSGVAEFHGLFEWLIGHPLSLDEIRLRSARSISAEFGVPPLPFPLELDTDWTGFKFPASYLDFPVDRPGWAIFERAQINFLFDVGNAPTGSNIADQVRRIAIEGLRNNQQLPSFDEAAVATGMSVATLRRRLVAQGTSYRQIKESCRREVGLRLLRYSSLSIEQIAAKLDYCDSDAFRRAFRHSLGVPPSRLRNEVIR